MREIDNDRRSVGARVVDGRGHSGGRFRRERMSPQREQLAKDCRGVLGRLRLWRELGGGVREIGGAIRGRREVLEGFRAELEGRHRWERIVLGKAHSEAVRGIERKAGEAYRGGMEGSEERAREAARTDGRSTLYDPSIDRSERGSVWEERMELVRELDGEEAYEKMLRAVERASQPPPSHVPSRSGPERDFGPSR